MVSKIISLLCCSLSPVPSRHFLTMSFSFLLEIACLAWWDVEKCLMKQIREQQLAHTQFSRTSEAIMLNFNCTWHIMNENWMRMSLSGLSRNNFFIKLHWILSHIQQQHVVMSELKSLTHAAARPLFFSKKPGKKGWNEDDFSMILIRREQLACCLPSSILHAWLSHSLFLRQARWRSH